MKTFKEHFLTEGAFREELYHRYDNKVFKVNSHNFIPHRIEAECNLGEDRYSFKISIKPSMIIRIKDSKKLVDIFFNTIKEWENLNIYDVVDLVDLEIKDYDTSEFKKYFDSFNAYRSVYQDIINPKQYQYLLSFMINYIHENILGCYKELQENVPADQTKFKDDIYMSTLAIIPKIKSFFDPMIGEVKRKIMEG